jgi:NAD(P)-dependent dehydrogenase (short-subunit alcohol dehydrogenase family)
MLRFAQHTVVVTGGSRGIGRACVEAFVANGASVVSLDVAPPEFTHARLRALSCDVADEEDVASALRDMKSSGVDVLVNCAASFGTLPPPSTELSSALDWDSCLAVNVKGTLHATRHCLPLMRASGTGAVVNFSSIAAFSGSIAGGPYAVSKAAILQMTRNFAVEAGKDGIRVNCVCPGPIRTVPTLRMAARWAELEGLRAEEAQSEMNRHLVLKRMGEPEEVAKAVLFLASKDASYITGTHLMVDGGYGCC